MHFRPQCVCGIVYAFHLGGLLADCWFHLGGLCANGYFVCVEKYHGNG